MSSDRLTPFSFVILVLVGRGGASPHDLRSYSERGRVYWDAAPSQWYAEPKRLAELGYLTARKEPGRTREKTVYEITATGVAALTEWAGTPASMPRMQHETIVRLLASDLATPERVLEGLAGLRAEVHDATEFLAAARERWDELPRRRELLEVNDRYAQRLLELQLAWLDEAEEVLRRRAARSRQGGGKRRE